VNKVLNYFPGVDSNTPVGQSKRATPSNCFKTPDLKRTNSVSQKRKLFSTPSKHPDTPIPKKTATLANQSLLSQEPEEKCNITVAIRVRPLNSK